MYGKKVKFRAAFILLVLISLVLIIYLSLKTLEDNVVYFLSPTEIQNKEEIRGPNINAPEKSLEGFLRSNQISKDQIFKKQTEKGEFYFFNKSEKKIKTFDVLEKNIPLILDEIQWKISIPPHICAFVSSF